MFIQAGLSVRDYLSTVLVGNQVHLLPFYFVQPLS